MRDVGGKIMGCVIAVLFLTAVGVTYILAEASSGA